GKHKKRRQKNLVNPPRSRRVKQQTSQSGNNQSDYDSRFISYPFDQGASGNRNDKIGTEEAKLNQGRFGVAQFKYISEVRNQDIVEAGYESPEKKQSRQGRQCKPVSLVGGQLCHIIEIWGARRIGHRFHLLFTAIQLPLEPAHLQTVF